LHIDDCIDAILIAITKSNEKINIFNLGTEETIEVNDSVKWVTEALDLSPTIIRGKENRGWIGDNSFIFLDTKKIKSLGWNAKYTIKEGILDTLQYLKDNSWLLEKRSE
jgi:UDP-glucose 4-epimerase